jgi:hypothetical protein
MIDEYSVGDPINIQNGFKFLPIPETGFEGSIIVRTHETESRYDFVDDQLVGVSCNNYETPKKTIDTTKIRVWRLGSLEHGVIPNKRAIERLKEILAENCKDDVFDLVWGPEIDVLELTGQKSVEVIDIDDEIERAEAYLEQLKGVRDGED